MEKDIEDYKNAKCTIARLEKENHIKEWKIEEGKRKVEEYMNKQLNYFKEQYPITDDDFKWLREDPNRQLWISETECVRSDPSKQRSDSLCTLNMNAFLPFEMTHLWGGGYDAMI